VVGAGQTGAEMGVDEVGPAVVGDEAVERCEIAADLPLLDGDAGEGGWGGGDVHGRAVLGGDGGRVEVAGGGVKAGAETEIQRSQLI
jgi:hypothetical protein